MNRNIDVESSNVFELINQYNQINISSQDAIDNFKIPSVPEFLKIGDKIDNITKEIQKLNLKLSDKLKEVQNTLENTINILQQNDEINMIDFIGQEDMKALLSQVSSKKSLQEEKNDLNNVIKSYEKLYSDLTSAFVEVYGKGIKYDTQKAYEMVKMFDALGLFSNNSLGLSKEGMFSFNEYYIENGVIKIRGKGSSGGFRLDSTSENYLPENQYLDPNAWQVMLNYCKEKNIFSALKSYVNENKSWEDSGLETLFGDNLRSIATFGNNEELATITTDKDGNIDAEMVFFYRFLGQNEQSLNSGINDANIYYLDTMNYKDFALGIEDLFENNSQNSYNRLIGDRNEAIDFFKDYLKEKNLFESFDDITQLTNDYNNQMSDMSSISSALYNLEHYQTLIDYEYDKKNSIQYLDYLYNDNLLNDYKNILPKNYQYWSQEDLALYLMYVDNNQRSRARDYFNAMQDMINKKIGFEKAANIVSKWNENSEEVLKEVLSSLESFGIGVQDGIIQFGNGLNAWFTDGTEMSEDQYRMMYLTSLLADNNEYNYLMPDIYRTILANNYNVGSSVGNMAIPVASSLLFDSIAPGSGSYISSALLMMSSGGNSYADARKNGASTASSYLYGIASGLSEVAFEKLLGGIAGLSNSTDAIENGIKGFIKGLTDEAKEEFLQTYVDGALRCAILGESFDLTNLTGDALQAALMAIQSAAVMNGTTNLTMKISDHIVNMDISGINALFDNSNVINISNDTAIKMGVNLKDGESLVFNPLANIYQIVDENGRIKRLDNSLITAYEPGNIATYSADDILQSNDITKAIAWLKNMTDEDFDAFFANLNSENANSEVSKFLLDFKHIYENGKDVAANPQRYNQFFQNFREHGINHALYVASYAYSIANSLGSAVNIDETLYAALAHDFGMQGGYTYWNAKTTKTLGDLMSNVLDFYGIEVPEGITIDPTLREEKFVAFMKENFYGKIINIEDLRKIAGSNTKVLDCLVRDNHPLNSAIAILTENNGLPASLDKSLVALLAMSHSKSTSGITVFNSKIQWTEAIDKLQATLDVYNRDHNTNFQFDSERLKRIVNGTDEESQAEFKRWQDEALAIRDGDAFAKIISKEGDGMLMQDGTISRVTTNEDAFNSNYEYPKYNSWKLEVEQIKDTVTNLDGNNPRDVNDIFSKRIHAGEQNIDFNQSSQNRSGVNSSYNKKGVYSAELVVKDANFAPYCTWEAIVERLGEVDTYTNAESRAFDIVLPAEAANAPHPNIADWYQEQVDDYVRKQMQRTIANNTSSPNVYTSDVVEKNASFYEIKDNPAENKKRVIRIIYK